MNCTDSVNNCNEYSTNNTVSHSGKVLPFPFLFIFLILSPKSHLAAGMASLGSQTLATVLSVDESSLSSAATGRQQCQDVQGQCCVVIGFMFTVNYFSLFLSDAGWLFCFCF